MIDLIDPILILIIGALMMVGIVLLLYLLFSKG